MSYAVYVFADVNRDQQKIRSDEVNWTGTWSSAGTYLVASYDSLIYGNDRYVAIIDNVGVNPTAKLPNRQPNPFSQLVTWQAGDEPPFAPPVAPPDVQYEALVTAWSGTRVAQEAYDIAVYGTNVANQAGTDAATALAAAYAGTAAAGTAVAVAADALSVATSIQGIAYDALLSSWAGTAAAAAGITLANSALTAAYVGTAAAVNRLPLAGGTLTGNLVVPNVQVGYGTVPYASASSGTIYYDFTGPAYQATTVREGTVFVSGSNMAAGREIAVILQQTGVFKSIGFSSAFTWYGTVPPTNVFTKNVLIAMTSLGTNLSDVIAGVSVAQ